MCWARRLLLPSIDGNEPNRDDAEDENVDSFSSLTIFFAGELDSITKRLQYRRDSWFRLAVAASMSRAMISGRFEFAGRLCSDDTSLAYSDVNV
jgi:hypothetical protein